MSIRNADVAWVRLGESSRFTLAGLPVTLLRPVKRPLALWHRRRAVGLLVVRDLRVRYASSALGYVWSFLEPLLLGLTYWFIFTQIFHRSFQSDEDPYIVFLLAGIFPWTWFSTCVSDAGKSLRNEAKLIHSTNVPREMWVLRVVVSKAIEFFFTLPVLFLFAVLYGARLNWRVVLILPGAALMSTLCLGIGLLLAPLMVLLEDLDRIIRLILRLGMYASPVVFTVADVPKKLTWLFAGNPVAGILELFRAGFFPHQVVWRHIEHSIIISLGLLLVGWLVFARLERTVLKEI